MAVAMHQLTFVYLEITGRCQLRCRHCYASSGPEGTHGTMSPYDWCHVIDRAGDLGAHEVQFIGGEPTLHPELAALIQHALDWGLAAEVYTNLARPISHELWELFALPGVRLATSHYSVDDAMHEAITLGPPRSHRRTRDNITGRPGRSGRSVRSTRQGPQLQPLQSQLQSLPAPL